VQRPVVRRGDAIYWDSEGLFDSDEDTESDDVDDFMSGAYNGSYPHVFI